MWCQQGTGSQLLHCARLQGFASPFATPWAVLLAQAGQLAPSAEIRKMCGADVHICQGSQTLHLAVGALAPVHGGRGRRRLVRDRDARNDGAGRRAGERLISLHVTCMVDSCR